MAQEPEPQPVRQCRFEFYRSTRRTTWVASGYCSTSAAETAGGSTTPPAFRCGDRSGWPNEPLDRRGHCRRRRVPSRRMDVGGGWLVGGRPGAGFRHAGSAERPRHPTRPSLRGTDAAYRQLRPLRDLPSGSPLEPGGLNSCDRWAGCAGWGADGASAPARSAASTPGSTAAGSRTPPSPRTAGGDQQVLAITGPKRSGRTRTC